MGHGRLAVEVNHHQRCEIEGGVRGHQEKDPPSAGEDCSENKAADKSLLNPRYFLVEVVRQGKQDGREEDDRGLGPHTGPKELPEALEPR